MLTIPQTLEVQAENAVQRVNGLRAPAGFVASSMLAGAYIGVGVVLMVFAAGPLLEAGDGFAKLVSGLVFGVALTLVVFAGADLVTSAMMVLPIGVAMRSTTAGRAAVALAATFVLNMVGALLFSSIVVLAGVLQASPAASNMLAGMLSGRADATALELFARGILCNALVCLAVWMGARVSSAGAKIALIYIAITAFVTSGFEHVVANMTIYSLGILSGDSNATFALYGGNLLWVGLGNLVGGGLIIGLAYWVIGGRPRFTPTLMPSRVGSASREV